MLCLHPAFKGEVGKKGAPGQGLCGTGVNTESEISAGSLGNHMFWEQKAHMGERWRTLLEC